MTEARLPVAIIGAGPVGLAAAAHVLARGDVPLILEAGPAVAHSIRQWGHVRMFTPWRYCVDAAADALLKATSWMHPPMEDVPIGADLVADYLEPLAALPALAQHLHLNSRVVAVTRKGCDKVRTEGRDALPFVLRVAGPGGALRSFEARAVIDASGTWTTPNPIGSDGLPAIGEEAAADFIATGIPDVLGAARNRYARRTTAVVGGGHSALNALIELAALREEAPETRILWIMRKARIEAAFGGEDLDGLPARGALGSRARLLVQSGAVEVMTPFRIAEIRRNGASLRVVGDHDGKPSSFTADQLIVATGFRPDLSLLREVRLTLDPWLESAGVIGPMIDPNLHSCGTVRPHGARELSHAEKDFYIAGIKSYGRAPTFLLATGHEQVRSIAAALAGDSEAAARVELVLPETGVCNTRPSTTAPVKLPGASSCCGPATVEPVQAGSSCCAPAKPAPAPAATCCGTAKREDAL